MALLTPYQLGSLKFFSFYVDLSAVAAYGAWAEFVLQPTGAFKVTSTSATFSTAEGHEVFMDSAASKGTVRFGSGSLAGGSYSIAEALPMGAARKLLEEEPSRTPTIESVTTECVFRIGFSLCPPLASPRAASWHSQGLTCGALALQPYLLPRPAGAATSSCSRARRRGSAAASAGAAAAAAL